MAERKAVIKNADMSEDMQQDAVDCASQALEKYNIEKDIAAYIKKEFDKKYNPTWHCIVGRNFGSYVTHETKHFIYFYLGQVAILLFKSGYPPLAAAAGTWSCAARAAARTRPPGSRTARAPSPGGRGPGSPRQTPPVCSSIVDGRGECECEHGHSRQHRARARTSCSAAFSCSLCTPRSTAPTCSECCASSSRGRYT
eukprot:GSChrysophyteH2.ASY1.ANO1.1592.1 assembled CDS